MSYLTSDVDVQLPGFLAWLAKDAKGGTWYKRDL